MKIANSGKLANSLGQVSTDEITVGAVAPSWDWNNLSETEHFVQFYDTDDFFLNSLSPFVGAGLQEGDAVILAATKPHLEGLESRLLAQGFNLTAARASGQYVPLDAEQTLAQIMVEGALSPQSFMGLIGGMVAQAADGRPRVRIFGELVALLWAEGKYETAIALEELWNDLGKVHPFSLFCAYPMNGFGKETHAEPLAHVCASHSRVIPAESYAALTDSDEQLRAIALLQQKAKSLEAEILERKKAEESLSLVKEELQRELEKSKQSLIREQIARGEAESANRMKDEFLATVSHELRTPLNAIIGWSHMLRGGRLDQETAARAIETIERNAKSQAQLVEDILDVSRVISGRLRLNMGPVDLSSVINTAIDSVQLAADSKKIELEVTLDPSARLIVGDSSRLQQIVWNLLSNAIKFTPSSGRVNVRLERVNSNVQIEICDSGQGISSELLPYVFDRFRQGDSSNTRRHGGLGLGLAIVRHLVELHGGTVYADSPGEGLGATFTIQLPLAVATKSPKSQKRRTENFLPIEKTGALVTSIPSLKDVQVLIVDDDRDTLQVLKVMLEENQAKVQIAGSAAEALELLEWYEPDVLVFDLAMPDEDGFSLIRRIRELEAKTGRQAPAVALTAHVRVEDRARALSAGFSMFVPKPVEVDELISAIANLVESEITSVM